MMDKNELAILLCKQYDSKAFSEVNHYNGNDLGANITSTGTCFKLWAPLASKVKLACYHSGEPDATPYQVLTMSPQSQGVWSYETTEQLDGVYYTYEITQKAAYTVENKTENDTTITGDVYAKACGVNGMKSMVVDLSTTNPKGWDTDHYHYNGQLQPIIYELHIQDFSYDKRAGFCAENRGKYLAFTEKHTCLNGSQFQATGIAYLQSLGITHVHILPMYDFGSIDESKQEDAFNWGYDPVNYNVPEGSYASDARNGKVRITEMKAMILALHEAGIGVIMDVVYNHTYSTDSFFQKTVPYYYYRLDAEGDFANGSACGNETASERFMYRKYMVDSILYWAKEYHLDGFRFDLMGLHDVETMNVIRESLNGLPQGEHILMYGEPWFAETPCMQPGAVPVTKEHLDQLADGIAIFSDDTRDAIKGSVFLEEVAGYVNGDLSKQIEIPSCILAHTDSKIPKVKQTNQIVSYISAHDNFTLYDKFVLSMTETKEFTTVNPELIQVNKLAAGINLTCCGYCFFQAGEEFARTKQGIGDSYQSPPSINQLDYQRAYELQDLVTYYRDLIAFRKRIPVFMENRENPQEAIQFIQQNNVAITGFVVSDYEMQPYYIAYNPCEHVETISLPTTSGEIINDGTRFVLDKITVGKQVSIPKKSMMIIRLIEKEI